MEVTREGVRHVVGFARQVVETGDVAVVALVHPEQPEEVGGDGVGCGAALAFPERCVEVVTSTQDGALSHVQSLCSALELEEATGQLQVGAGDGSPRVLRRH